MSWTRLAPGVEIVAMPGLAPVVRGPDGEFLRINAPSRAVAGVLELLGHTAPAWMGEAHQDAQEIDRLLDAFAAAGYLGAPFSWPSERANVLVLGDERLTAPVTEFLAAAGARPRPARPRDVTRLACAPASGSQASGSQDVADVAAVVWCLDRPVPQGLWQDADRLPERGIAWARCHREGWQAWVEPIAAGPGGVLAAHVAARRLAASPAHRELAAYWAGHTTAGPDPVTGAAAAAAVAALVATDLAAWAMGRADRGGGLPAHRRLRRIDLRDLSVTEHCVLPIPPVAPIADRHA
ncbi:hypothetical protein AB0K60_13405 [Thermopolyspora sp. NPDC052614]|uniref:hypothetical protein n=1 Tax=Thermopolyspora sp. NPDC052614 TaxID=3155682 RepID=UPI0034312097